MSNFYQAMVYDSNNKRGVPVGGVSNEGFYFKMKL